MTRKWLLALALGVAFPAIPATALDDNRGPLSPSGGYSSATAAAASNEGNDRRMFGHGGGFGFFSRWAADADDIRGPLTPSSDS